MMAVSFSDKVEYIAAAIRFASQESGLKDFDGFFLIVSEFEFDGRDTILGLPVLIGAGLLEYNYLLAYPWDCNQQRLKAMREFKEYQSIYPDIKDGE